MRTVTQSVARDGPVDPEKAIAANKKGMLQSNFPIKKVLHVQEISQLSKANNFALE